MNTARNRNRKNPNEIFRLPEGKYDLVKGVLGARADDFIQIGPKKYLEDDYYEEFKEEIYNYPLSGEDVWVVTLPRSGTTLTQELVWQVSTNLDFENGFKIPLVERFPFLEFPLYRYKEANLMEDLIKKNLGDETKIKSIRNVFTPEWKKPCKSHFIKTHLPLSLLNPDLLDISKVVYVARNPKDQHISRYNFYKMLQQTIPAKFEDFWPLMEEALVPCCPFFDHVQEAWTLRENKNMLFLFYEDIVADLPSAIRRVAKFLNKTLTEAQVTKLADHLKIENFKKNKSVADDYKNYFDEEYDDFVRTGKIDGWKEEYFTPELNQRADDWIKKQYQKTDLRFPTLKL